LSTSVAFDLLHLATKNRKLGESAFSMLAAGLIGGLASAPFGFRDWLAIPEGTRAKAIGAWHGGGNLLVTGLFGASWALRRGAPAEPAPAAIGLSLAGGALALLTGWLGGELVYRLRVGVDDVAQIDASSSYPPDPSEASEESEQGHS
jgi:uncharacterized membrane protein